MTSRSGTLTALRPSRRRARTRRCVASPPEPLRTETRTTTQPSHASALLAPPPQPQSMPRPIPPTRARPQVLLKPCAIYKDPFRPGSPNILVLCDCYKPDPDGPRGLGAPIPTNTRVYANQIMDKVTAAAPAAAAAALAAALTALDRPRFDPRPPPPALAAVALRLRATSRGSASSKSTPSSSPTRRRRTAGQRTVRLAATLATTTRTHTSLAASTYAAASKRHRRPRCRHVAHRLQRHPPPAPSPPNAAAACPPPPAPPAAACPARCPHTAALSTPRLTSPPTQRLNPLGRRAWPAGPVLLLHRHRERLWSRSGRGALQGVPLAAASRLHPLPPSTSPPTRSPVSFLPPPPPTPAASPPCRPPPPSNRPSLLPRRASTPASTSPESTAR